MAWLLVGQGLRTAPPTPLRGPWEVSVGRSFLAHLHTWPLPSHASCLGRTEPGIKGQPEVGLGTEVPVSRTQLAAHTRGCFGFGVLSPCVFTPQR